MGRPTQPGSNYTDLELIEKSEISHQIVACDI